MAAATIFKPPYLDYGVPADLQKIKDKIRLLTARTITSLGGTNLPRSSILTPAGGPPGPGTRVGTPAAGLVANVPGRRDGDPAPGRPRSAKAAILEISLTPAGVVPLGFNCRETFEALTSTTAYVTHMVWELLLMDQQTGNFDQILFMGGQSSLNKSVNFGHITFDHDFSSYRHAAYASPNKTAIFMVRARPFVLSDELGPLSSNHVTLDFNHTSCIGIHSIGLSTNSVTGGDNGDQPILTVALDAPAGPGGQEVRLSESSSHGHIKSPDSFVIPAGQTSGQIGDFLATDRVYTTGKSITVTVELVSPGGKSGPGYATIKLTKQ